MLSLVLLEIVLPHFDVRPVLSDVILDCLLLLAILHVQLLIDIVPQVSFEILLDVLLVLDLFLLLDSP